CAREGSGVIMNFDYW
nr:immunoglobulin heavy chain junction region [Macaca mulatta]MOX91604.1 immunoglobulin heavy chain junction region [Macaca mulatta]MOX91605.1 immunoglobulin heavy chain junction region [Macaca mulatta]MOX91697.1 immunoglobulin heavy chain junction region [Macaca mulatta]MOX92486.1 immunoglobulin heavy chain junction region [Macaca mulatta]